jgi:3'-phosphoadenosine 5'-phosphosulfate sulfotransferase (PAPS reductase)/FAD synthetase
MPLDALPDWTPRQGSLFNEAPSAPPADPTAWIVAVSGGKDSVACVLHLLDQGIDRSKIILIHHHIDGAPDHAENGGTKWDWPCTPAYVRALAQHFGVRLIDSWRVGGFSRELLKQDDRTAPVQWIGLDGIERQAGGVKGSIGTRRRFPSLTANLATRWCSAILKIDVADFVLRNDPAFTSGEFVFVTGERAEESANRARYAELEPHRSTRKNRPIHHWRPVLRWSEARVWDALHRHGINPHPCYRLGWSRASCMTCIFGSDQQWADIGAIDPTRLDRLSQLESEFGWTIRNNTSLAAIVARTPARDFGALASVVSEAMDPHWAGPIAINPATWTIPIGAFGAPHGPS